MGRMRKPFRLGAIVLLALGAGAISSFFILTRTSVGQALVLEAALQRVEGVVNGEILVSGIRSAGLHRGARLVGVQVNAPDGSPLLVADSVEAEYSIGNILRGDVLLAGVTLWRPTFSITRPGRGERFNVSAFLAGRQDETQAPPSDEVAAEEQPSGGGRLVLEDVTIHDGSLDVRYPLASAPGPESRIVTAQGPDGVGPVRSLAFQEIEAHLERLSIVDPEIEGLRAEVDRFAMEGHVFSDPVRIREFGGRVEWLDDRIQVTADRLALPGTEASGLATVDLIEGSLPELSLDFVAPQLDLADLQWLQPTLPDARGSAGVGVNLGPEGLEVRWSAARLGLEGGEVAGDGVFRKPSDGEASLQDVSIDVSGIPVAFLAGYLPSTPALDGRVHGYVGLSGTMDALSVTGRVALMEPGMGPSGGEIEGVLHLRPPLGATDLHARFTPIDLGLANRFAEGLQLDGAMRLDIRADGRMDQGVQVALDATYPDPQSEESHITVEGSLTDVEGDVFVSLEGDLEPLSIAGLFGEESPLSRLGVARGTVEAEGPLSAMALKTDLTTGGGALTLESRFDVRSPLTSYRLLGESRDFDLPEVLPALPEGTVFSGSLDLRGEGGSLRTAELSGDVQLRASRFAHLDVDTAAVRLRISEGILTVDTLQSVIGGVEVQGAGRLAMAGSGSTEELQIQFETENLEGLRPLVLGPDVIARDTLSALELSILALEDIDPDTLPTLAQVFVSGRMDGGLTIGGSLEDLDVRGQARLEDGRYGDSRLGDAAVSFSASGLLSPERAFEADIDADEIRVFDRVFDSVSVRLEYQEPRGRMNLFVVHSEEESYQARVAFEQEDAVRTLHLDELVLRFPDERWNLGGPATIAWDPDGLTFRDLRLIRPGVGGMRLRAQGRLPFRGEADFDLSVQGLDVGRIAHVLQMNERLEGMVNVELEVAGSDQEPIMAGTLSAADFRFRDYDFERLVGAWDYEDRAAVGGIELWKDSIQVLTVSGELPLDLAFHTVPDRIPDEPIDLVVGSQELPLSLLMAPFESYQEVEGTLSGRVELGGTTESLAPSGQLVISGGGAFLRGLGVRHRDMNGTLDWFPDGRVEVDGSVSALGTANVLGTVTLAPASDPGFDLAVSLDAFQGMDRQDVTGRLSGDFRVEGSYRRPVVSGNLLVDEGTLFVEEFQRAAEIVDLSDPAFYEVVDTTVVDLRPLLAGQNPFLRNIRMENMTLTVQRNSWIRSDRMDVELDGELQVLYDRLTQDLAMVGTLEAVRGSYGAFGRQFQVDGGTMRFLGTPGINPDLNIQASNRVRSAQGDRFTITAAVTGTLVSPRIGLTSDQAGVTEDDLLSYLYFGRPTYALTSGQTQALGAAGALLGSGVTLGLSTFSNRLGSAVAQELGVDYLTITQQDLGALGDASLRGTLGTTVVETGFYLAEDFFVTLLLRPLSSQGTGSQFAGIRFEWVASNAFTVESFFEDRFFRGRVVGFGELGIQNEKGLGLFIFREWAY